MTVLVAYASIEMGIFHVQVILRSQEVRALLNKVSFQFVCFTRFFIVRPKLSCSVAHISLDNHWQ